MSTMADRLAVTPPPSDYEPLLQFFRFAHLKPELAAVSAPFGELAKHIMTLPRNAERTVALRKLLEAKDCAVRAFIAEVPDCNPPIPAPTTVHVTINGQGTWAPTVPMSYSDILALAGLTERFAKPGALATIVWHMNSKNGDHGGTVSPNGPSVTPENGMSFSIVDTSRA